MSHKINRVYPCPCAVVAVWLAVLMVVTVSPTFAGPQHYGFGMSYLATVKTVSGTPRLVVYEGPLRAKDCAWIPRWVDNTTNMSSIAGIAAGNFWPSDPGKEYLEVVSLSGTTVTVRTLEPPECFSVAQWTQTASGTIAVTTGTIVGSAAGDLLAAGKDQLVLLHQNGTTLKIYVLSPPSSKTGTTWTVSKQTTIPTIAGTYKGFAIGDFWGDDTQKIAIATEVSGATVLNYYSYNPSGSGTVTLLTTDTATDLPVIANNGLVATDYVKDKFDVLTLIPADSAAPFQVRSAPLRPGTSYNPGPVYTGLALSRQRLPGFSGTASALVMTGTFSDGGSVPSAVAGGRVFGYMINPPGGQYTISASSDAEIAMIHRTPLKGDCPPHGWPAYGATVTWDICIKNNGTNTIPAGAVLKWWINTPKRSADTDPTTMDSPFGTYTIPTAIPPYDPDNPDIFTHKLVTCPWPYSLIPCGPRATAMKINLEAVGERWLIASLTCPGDTNLRNNRYEAMLGGLTLRPSLIRELFADRGAWIAGNPSSTEYCYRELADAVLCMFERSGTYDNLDVLQRPYLDSIGIGLPEDEPTEEEQRAAWALIQRNYEGWRSQRANCQTWGPWPRFDWSDGGEELHETTHLFQSIADLYQYYVFPTQTSVNTMADGTPVQLKAYCWYPDSFGTGHAMLGVPTMEYMRSFIIGEREFEPNAGAWCYQVPDRTWVRILDRDGNPVPNAQVQFWAPADSTVVGTGTTDATGRWEITSFFGNSPYTDDYGRKNYPAYQNNGLTDALGYVFTVSVGGYQDQAMLGSEDFSSYGRYALLYHSVRDEAGWTWDFKTNYKSTAPAPTFTLAACVQGNQVQLGITGAAGATYKLYRRWEPDYVRRLVGTYVAPGATLALPQDLSAPDSFGGNRSRALFEVTQVAGATESLPRAISVNGVGRVRGITSDNSGKLLVAENAGLAQPTCELFDGTTPYEEFFYHFRFGHTLNKVVRSRLNPAYYYANLIAGDAPGNPDSYFDLMEPPSAQNGSWSYDGHWFISNFSIISYTTTAPYTFTVASWMDLTQVHPGDAIRVYESDSYAVITAINGQVITTQSPVWTDPGVGTSIDIDRFAGVFGTDATMRQLKYPRGMDAIVVGGQEFIATADSGNRRLVMWDDLTGYVTHYQFADGAARPAGVALHPLQPNKLFVLDRHSTSANSKLYLFTFDGTNLSVDPGYPVSVNVGDYGYGVGYIGYYKEMGLAAAADPTTGGVVIAITNGAQKRVLEYKLVGTSLQLLNTFTAATGTYAGTSTLLGPLDVAYTVADSGLALYASDVSTSSDFTCRVVKLTGRTFTAIDSDAAKSRADGTLVQVGGVTTATFSADSTPNFYVENADRSSGIQVRCGGALPAINTNVTFIGTLGTDPITHERFVQASSWTAGASQTVPALAMSARTLGGAAYALQEGVADGRGLSNIGMLVKIAGKVTATTGDGSSFYISDGSRIRDGNEPDGVKVDLSAIPSASRARPLQGDLVAVKGISTTYLQEGGVCRMVRARSASDVTNLSVVWSTFTGPGSDTTTYNHIGTDGTSLYAVFNDNTLRKYTFSQASPAAGAWTQLASPPKTVNGSNSFSDLAYQNGYLYTSAISGSSRTILRYRISDNTWQTWQNGGVDITICTTTGNGMFMDPTLDGVGYSASESSSKWVKFDWNAKTANNSWMSTSGLPGSPSGYVARGEDVATNGSGVYYATKNDTTAGLSTGDLVYTWSGLTSPTPSVLTAKPWLAGCGQSIEFVPASVSPSGNDELWMIRGADGSSSPGTGTGNPTGDWARLDLSNVSYGWSVRALPGVVRYPGEIVRIGDCVFVRGTGYNWFVAKLR